MAAVVGLPQTTGPLLGQAGSALIPRLLAGLAREQDGQGAVLGAGLDDLEPLGGEDVPRGLPRGVAGYVDVVGLFAQSSVTDKAADEKSLLAGVAQGRQGVRGPIRHQGADVGHAQLRAGRRGA